VAHQHLEFAMPARVAIVFDTLDHHHWRVRRDSLASATRVLGGATWRSGSATVPLGWFCQFHERCPCLLIET
jgi:hypothetical protein